MTTKKKSSTFAGRDVALQLNNAVVHALRPASLGGALPDARLRKLRTYAQAAVSQMLKHVEEELLRPEELVIVLSTAALFVQLDRVMKTVKVPMGGMVMDLFEGTEPVVLPELYHQTPPATDDEILPKLTPATRKRKKV